MTTAKIEELTRGQAFAFAAYVALTLREDRRRREAAGLQFGTFESSGARAVYAETLDVLLWSGIEEFVEWPDTRGYCALLDGVNAGVTYGLLARLRGEAARGGGIRQSPQGRSWACARILMELEEIVGGSGRTLP
jgi:hypothetical protein